MIKTEVISNYLKENNLTKKKFCEMCNMSIATLNKILAGNMKIRLKFIVNICDITGMKCADFIKST